MPVFRGVNAINLDAKGRLALPAKYRDLLADLCEGKLVITIDTEERCLLLYPLNEWEEIERKIEALPSFNKAARRIQRLLLGHASDTEMDGQGRILINAPLREYADLEKKMVLIGQGKKFELWSEQRWQEKRDQWLEECSESAEQLPEQIENLSL